jgi:hypothetical protein
MRHKLRKAAAMLAAALTATFLIANPAAAWPPAVANGHLIASVSAAPYQATLDWDTCSANDGTYLYLEIHSSRCGSGGWGAVWSYSFASRSSLVAVCHSDDHSNVTWMYFNLAPGGGGTLYDSAGGGCRQGNYSNRVTTFQVIWGDARSPTIRANY